MTSNGEQNLTGSVSFDHGIPKRYDTHSLSKTLLSMTSSDETLVSRLAVAHLPFCASNWALETQVEIGDMEPTNQKVTFCRSLISESERTLSEKECPSVRAGHTICYKCTTRYY